MKDKIHKIKRADLQEIYTKVCSDWQSKIDAVLTEQKFNSEIEVENSIVLQAYKEGKDEHKKLIDKHFDLEHPKSLFHIKDYSAVCKALEEDEVEESDFKFLPKERRKKACARAKLQQLEIFYNQDWIKDWRNQSQYKYYPYFTVTSGGSLVFGFSYSYYSYFYALAYFKDSETAEFVGKNYIDIYKDLM